MISEYSNDYLIDLVRDLCKLPKETEWVEFKLNNDDPDEIGEYISALSNAAAIKGKNHSYIIWGVEDETHEIVGTSFRPGTKKIGNEELQSWLLRLISPKISFHFFEVEIDGKAVVLLEIQAAHYHPVRFKHQDFIRIGSYKKKLKDDLSKERELWRVFDETPFEQGIAVEHVAADKVFELLDYPSYFHLLELPLPEGRQAILDAFASDELIYPSHSGNWNISNLGAVLFAKNLGHFSKLRRKALRVIQYKGQGRTMALREQVYLSGYASGFEGLISFIMGLVPASETVGQALRHTNFMFPERAVRELVANALIHQNFFMTGVGPMVEIFDDRMEITSPGKPLVDILRFLDTPPKSRNETLASLMRRFRICEERGSGVDQVVEQIEYYQLPAPQFEIPDESTRAVLFAHKKLSKMDKTERVQACYLHACLKQVMRDYLTNASLRERFGIEEKNKAVISRYIREAVMEKRIKPFDEGAPKKLMKYVPYWA